MSNERTFKVNGETQSVDDVMFCIPHRFREEFIGANFDSWKSFGLCLAHADTAFRARLEKDWRYEDEVKAMRAYLK